jgi:hypothetical protein
MRHVFTILSVLILSGVVAAPAAAQLKLPGKAASEDTEEEEGSVDSADVLVGQVVGGFDAVAGTFERAAKASLTSTRSLLEALGATEQAAELRQTIENLKAIEDPQERQAQIAAVLSDPAISADLASAVGNVVELDDARRQSISDANLLNLRAAFTFTEMASNTVQLTSAVAQLGLGLTNPSTIAAMDRAGKSPEWFKETLKPSLKSIDKGAKAFDKAAKKNRGVLKDLMKRFDIKPPAPAEITPIDESSKF